jgi:hypothetical protein
MPSGVSLVSILLMISVYELGKFVACLKGLETKVLLLLCTYSVKRIDQKDNRCSLNCCWGEEIAGGGSGFSILRFVVHTFKYLLGNPTIGNSALGGGTTLLRLAVFSTSMMFWRLTSSTRYVSSIGIISNDPPMNHLLSIPELMFNDDARLIYFVLRFFGGQVSKDPDKNHFVWLQHGSEVILSITCPGSATCKR